MSLTKNMILEMLEMQNRLEIRISGEDWTKLEHDYALAIFMESAEAIDHHGWKWWKMQECNLPQMQLELVDIWHFAMAWLLQQNDGAFSFEELAEQLQIGIESVTSEDSVDIAFIDAMVALGTAAMSSSVFSFSSFIHACRCASLGPIDLYEKYIGKNVLNLFRQDHGYKEGTYNKHWEVPIIDGQPAGLYEDNDVLNSVMFSIKKTEGMDSLTYENVYARLSRYYNSEL